MKLPETFLDSKNSRFAIKILCFIYAGLAAVLFLGQIYSVFWLNQSLASHLVQGELDVNTFGGSTKIITTRHTSQAFVGEIDLNSLRRSVAPEMAVDANAAGAGPATVINRVFVIAVRKIDPMKEIVSPASLIFIVSGLISLLAGLTIWRFSRERDIQSIKQEAADYLLLPDEKKVISVLKHSGYESTQKKLSTESGLSRVQVHRVIKKLEAKGLLEKHDYGMTNKIILKKDLFE